MGGARTAFGSAARRFFLIWNTILEVKRMSNTKKAARMAAFLLALIMSLSMALQAVSAEPAPDEGQAEAAEELQAAEGVLERSETDPFTTASFPEEGPETDALEGEPGEGEEAGEEPE